MIEEGLSIIVDPDGMEDIESIVTHAIIETQGRDRLIEVISERDLGSSFPGNARLFVVQSMSTECRCESKCTWYDSVFHGNGRCVVVAMSRESFVSIGAVIQCLAEPL
jgi:hypothetical protein